MWIRHWTFFFNSHPMIHLLILEREEGRETSNCLPYTSRPGNEPQTSGCILTGDQTGNFLVCGAMLQPPEPPGQDKTLNFSLNRFPSKSIRPVYSNLQWPHPETLWSKPPSHEVNQFSFYSFNHPHTYRSFNYSVPTNCQVQYYTWETCIKHSFELES